MALQLTVTAPVTVHHSRSFDLPIVEKFIRSGLDDFPISARSMMAAVTDYMADLGVHDRQTYQAWKASTKAKLKELDSAMRKLKPKVIGESSFTAKRNQCAHNLTSSAKHLSRRITKLVADSIAQLHKPGAREELMDDIRQLTAGSLNTFEQALKKLEQDAVELNVTIQMRELRKEYSHLRDQYRLGKAWAGACVQDAWLKQGNVGLHRQ